MVHVQTFPPGNLQLAGVETELMQDSGVNIRHVMPMFDGVKAKLIGHPVSDSTLNSAARQSRAEPLRMMGLADFQILICAPAHLGARTSKSARFYGLQGMEVGLDNRAWRLLFAQMWTSD